MADKFLEFPRIYCINLKESTGRRQRMEKRFAHHGFSKLVTFVEAIPRYSSDLNYYTQDLVCPHNDTKKWLGELACYASHLKAVRRFVDDGGEYGIICEDDIMLVNNFLSRYVNIALNIPNGTPLVTMAYMLETLDGSQWAGNNPDQRNLLTINPVATWGAQIYWLTRDYALRVLEMYDKPFRDVENPLRTSEVIIRQSGGLRGYPPMAIEDCIDSDREPGDLSYHMPHFSFWGYENYNSGEGDVHLSPLAKTS